MDCSWFGNPAADYITWQKIVNNVTTDINISGSNGKYVGGIVLNPSLTITVASYDDQADYVCTATNAVGKAFSERISLNVIGCKF